MALENKPFFLKGHTSHACLMLHGLGAGAYEMQFLGESLYQQGLTVQGILYPGHDKPGKMPRSRWQDWYTHIVDTYQTLAQTYEQVSIIGFSTGCPLGLYLASENPVHKLVMLAPYFRLRSEWYYGLPLETYVKTLGWIVTDVPRMGLPIFDTQMHQEAVNAAFFRNFNIGAVRSAMDLIEQVKPRLAKIQNPMLIIQSRQDRVVDPAGASYLYEHVSCVEKKLLWLENSDHIITLDRDRKEVYKRVGEFLTECSD
jgi:carboxylesterase